MVHQMPRKTATQRAIEEAAAKYGGKKGLGALLGVTKQAVIGWVDRDRVPAKRVLELEKLSGVSRHELRPDIYGPRPSVRRKSTAVAA